MAIEIDTATPRFPQRDSTLSNDILSRYDLCHLVSEAQKAQVFADARALDWVWNIVGQLKLTGVVANALVTTRNGAVGVEDGDRGVAIEQRIVVGSMLLNVCVLFVFDTFR